MDIKEVFLHGDLEEEIYMEQPYSQDDSTDLVCTLQKALYGLKQAGNKWYKKFQETLEGMGFKWLDTEHCVYIKTTEGWHIIVTTWVNDLLIFGNRLADIEIIKNTLKEVFKMKDLGEPKHVIGMEFAHHWVKWQIYFSQWNYIDKILHQMGLEKCNPIQTLMDKNIRLRAWAPEGRPSKFTTTV